MFKWFKNKKKDNKGFTLVELVIVIAILAILVGLLAPQYTKYVEKSRKAADASNMDEMVKVIKVYAADPANELEMGTYAVTISATGTQMVATPTDKNAVTYNKKSDCKDGLAKELEDSIPSWYNTKTKSQKWGKGGKVDSIIATVTVGKDGGTSVTYTNGNGDSTKFADYMANGSEKK